LFRSTHVHFYDCFDLDIFLDSALLNFTCKSISSGWQNAFTGVLLLAETSKDNWFEYLSNYSSKNNGTYNWTFHSTNESCSLVAKNRENNSLVLISGSQIITKEGLELLALATNSKFKDGTSLEQLITEVKKAGGIPLIPWGFGKWVGKRGTVLKTLIEKNKNFNFFLGENGGRPKIFASPSIFKIALKKKIKILSGSDPLPLISDETRPGSSGFIVYKDLEMDYPSICLKTILLNKQMKILNYRYPQTISMFIKNQFLMNMAKKKR